ncbi:MAG TPA: glutamine--fructose-6-phosphate transaminase (isomerizing) [Actinomycetota bacterium]|nr:glutamine--fructose-6-phosphate transaminase (isomerizing) [Actinomycetota bacterium]
MCGIVGYVGSEQALPILMDGLSRLEYRGYDSAGVAIVDGGVNVIRKAGKLEILDKELTLHEIEGTTGIGHTRWATHGGPTDANAHPHRDCTGRIALIHNGIIENFVELREELESEGHVFASETDTEVIAHLIEAAYDGDFVAAFRAALKRLDGAFSLAVVSSDEPGVVVAAKRTSPLLVGRGEHGTLLASDPPALLPYTRDMVHIHDDQVVVITSDGFTITTLEGEPAEGEAVHVDWDIKAAEKAGFEHFMLKEIYEQPEAVADTLRGRTVGGRLMLDELRMSETDIRDVDKVFVVACGTSYHAAMVAKYAIEHWTRIPVEIELASEFRYRDPVLDRDTLVIAVSQSGETIDTLEAARHAKEQHAKLLSVVNVVGSSIARASDAVLYTHAGPEIAVASTKAFETQMVALKLVALYLAQVRATLYPGEIEDLVREMGRLPELIERTLGLRPAVQAVAREIVDARDVLFLGRHVGFPVALEGALKLKEISYVHAEGYAAGELKHGPIALVEEGVPVVAVATQSHVYQKVLSNILEVKARGALVIAVVTEGDTEVRRHADHVLEVPAAHQLFTPELVAVPLQMLAYEIAVLRGTDLDQPRNLAKSVTVE